MANNNRQRVLFQSEAVFVGPANATGALTTSGSTFPGLYGNKDGQLSGNSLINQLTRVQSCNYSVQIPRIDINQLGELGAIDRPNIAQPNVSLDLSYISAGFANENYLGLTVTPTGATWTLSCISGFLNKTSDDHTFFVVDAQEGQDVNGNASINVAGTNTYGFGPMYLTSYSTQGQVGQLPTVDVRLEGLNMVIQTGIYGNTNPSVFPTNGTRVTGWFYKLQNAASNPNPGSGDLAVSAIRPGDLNIYIYNSGTNTEMSDFGATVSAVSGAVQSYRLGFDLRREDLLKLGSKFAYTKEIQFPVSISCSVNALLREANTGDLAQLLCNDNTYDVEITALRPGCLTDATRPIIARYRLLGVKLDGTNYGLQVGQNKSVTLDFSRQIGSASQQVGLFLSGVIGSNAS